MFSMEGEFTTYGSTDRFFASSMQSAHADCFRAGFGVAGAAMVTSGTSLLLTEAITLSIYSGSGLKIVRYFCRIGRAIVSTSSGSWFGVISKACILNKNVGSTIQK